MTCTGKHSGFVDSQYRWCVWNLKPKTCIGDFNLNHRIFCGLSMCQYKNHQQIYQWKHVDECLVEDFKSVGHLVNDLNVDG